jgi:hypothetical protein
MSVFFIAARPVMGIAFLMPIIGMPEESEKARIEYWTA